MTNTNETTKYSLKTWVLVLALAPTILVGILLGGYFTIDRFYQLEDTLIAQGSNIIEPLAIASEAPLRNHNIQVLRRLLTNSQLSRSPQIHSIAIFNNKNQLVTSARSHPNINSMRYQGMLTDLHHTKFQDFGDTLLLTTPIFDTRQTTSANTELHPDNQEKLGYVVVRLNKQQTLLEYHRAAIAAFVIVIIGVQLNLLFTFRLVKNVTQPIGEMVRVVAKIREGKLDTRLQGNLIGELDLLKRGINAMASSLSEYHDEMQQNIDQATSDLRETLEQIEIQNVELDLAKKRALEASRIKSEFLANMSHELRTPLNGVIGFARQLLKTPLHPNQLEYIRTIERSAINLLSIINDILDFSKLEAGKMVLDNTPFGLRDLLNDTLALIAGSAREKNLELVIDIDPNVPDTVSGDAIRVGQIITNLVGNAIKFTDSGSVLLRIKQMTSRDQKVTLRCEVIDTGIGIDEKQQALLFQAFGQADSSISRRFGGTGLGLVITKRLINQMNGEIGFTSSPAKGSTFWFVLPLQLDPFLIYDEQGTSKLNDTSLVIYQPRPLSMSVIAKQLKHWQMQITALNNIHQLKSYLSQEHKTDYMLISNQGMDNEIQLINILNRARKLSRQLIVIDDCVQENLLNKQANLLVDKVITPPIGNHNLRHYLLAQGLPELKTPLAAPVNQQSAPLAITVLAVDDNLANLKLIEALLNELVTHVVSVKSGDEAIKQAQNQRFDLIFMDIQMPGIDGITATQSIRQHSLNRHTPIIAVTAHTIAEERERIMGCGMDAYLTKPIDEAALIGVMNKWLARPQSSETKKNTLNWQLCLMQTNQKTELAIEMLQMMLDSLPHNQNQIEQALKNNDQQQMLSLIHKLHGASCYCGVPNTQKLCQEIESALKHGANINDIEPEVLELLDELTKVESAATKLIAQFTVEITDDQ